MAGSVFDSPMYTKRFPVGEAGRLFTDTADVRAMLLVLGSLAKVQGDLGVVPEDSAFFIHRSSMECQIDPAGLADGMAEHASPVLALIEAFAKAMEAPEHSRFIGTGIRAEDVSNTALALRLRQVLSICEKEAGSVSGMDVLLGELPDVRASVLQISFAADNGDPQATKVRQALADALKLGQEKPFDIMPALTWLSSLSDRLADLAEDRKAGPQIGALAGQNRALLAALMQNQSDDMLALCLSQICLSTMACLQLF